jgi:hypothetical protein
VACRLIGVNRSIIGWHSTVSVCAVVAQALHSSLTACDSCSSCSVCDWQRLLLHTTLLVVPFNFSFAASVVSAAVEQ